MLPVSEWTVIDSTAKAEFVFAFGGRRTEHDRRALFRAKPSFANLSTCSFVMLRVD
jgi:hypothetical protein